MRRIAALAVTTLSLAVASLVVATPASAHVITETATAPAGSYSTVTFSILHGCEDAPTTAVTIELPEGIIAVTPTEKWNWAISSTVVPATVPGTSITERTSSVTFTAETPLPSDQRTSFELWLGMPDGEVGDTVVFDSFQECEGGLTQDWIGDEAPTITLTEAEAGGGHGHGGEVIPSEGVIPGEGGQHESEHTEASPTATDPTSRLLSAGALLLGVIAVAIAIVGRRKPEATYQPVPDNEEPGRD